MKTTNVTKKITTLTEWKNESTNHYVQHESDTKTLYYFTPNRLVLSFEEHEAVAYLAMCDAAVSNDLHELEAVPDTAFLSMVLSQFLHVPKVDTIHKDSNHN